LEVQFGKWTAKVKKMSLKRWSATAKTGDRGQKGKKRGRFFVKKIFIENQFFTKKGKK
jgi:hypothetical protein